MTHLLKHFKDLSIHPKNAAELKGLILQLAVQGKLTANWRLENPGVEPASVLLERIQAEKVLLLKDKKIKKEKPLPEITKEEIPFNLPTNWQWCKMIDAIHLVTKGATPTSYGYQFLDKGINFIKIESVKGGEIKTELIDCFISEEADANQRRSKLVEGDILFSIAGTIGATAIVKLSDLPANTNQALAIIRGSRTVFIPIFLQVLLDSFVTESTRNRARGAAMNNISLGDLKEMLVPIPPKLEQKAIVSTVNTLFAEVEQLEALTKERIQLKEDFVTSALQQLTNSQSINGEWAFLQQHFPTFFTELPNIKKLRESILQLAVQGKLTTQWRKENTNVEDVNIDRLEALRKTYQIEAARKKGQKSFKYKNSVKIDVGGKSKGVDSLFDISSTWEWVSLGQIAWSINDGPHFSPKYVDEGGVPMISGRNITFEKGIDFTTAKNVSENDHIEFTKRGKPDIGDVLLTKGGTTGVPCVVETSKEFSVWVHVALIKMIKEYVDPYYLKKALASPFVYRQSQEQTHGIGNKDLGLTRMIYFAIPLPPIKEQKVIVEKVNTLMALCDQLEQEIQNSKATQEDWMKSSLREVFALEAKNKELESGDLGMVAEPGEEYKK
jgi:type I restriction enzyme S subunit